MHKATVTYEDFNGRAQIEDLYFNISKTEIADNLDLEERFQAVLPLFDGGPREWTRSEVEIYLGLVKHVMRLAYGERSEDGKRFRKSEAIWDDFKSSAVYDAYLFSLFSEPEKANEFLSGVFPPELRAAAQAEIEKNGGVVPVAPKEDNTLAATDIEAGPTDEELLKMHPADMTEEQRSRAYMLRFGNK